MDCGEMSYAWCRPPHGGYPSPRGWTTGTPMSVVPSCRADCEMAVNDGAFGPRSAHRHPELKRQAAEFLPEPVSRLGVPALSPFLHGACDGDMAGG
mmetsp:Transcript_46180/g.93142  ORF Transcript_46180/g.93142 Transcript_46180/m.93142 type:complete len:96 (-) Transcript_46180:57-344(-)